MLSSNRSKLAGMGPEKNNRETARVAALDYLGAIRPEADGVLQQLVDEVRGMFGTDLCMVNLILPSVQYFRAWSGELPADLAQVRQDPRERSMCQYVVDTEAPFVVEDFLDTEEFKDQYFGVNYGIRFYAGTPLVTSEGHAIGSICLLSSRPTEFGEEQMKVLGAFARAVVGRLELLGALGREQAVREEEARRGQELRRTLDSLSAHIAILDESGTIITVNHAWREFARANGSALDRLAEGMSYLEICDSATGPKFEGAAAFAEGIRAVISGRRRTFELEYACHSPDKRRWFIGRVTPFSADGPPRAVVAHENITERKLAEEERERLLRREREISCTLQRALLPPDLPNIPGVELAARYVPAGEGLEVGGDLYDIFSIPEGRWALVVGDVIGKGPKAAALTSLARYTIRAAAALERSPQKVLRMLNEEILRQRDYERLCTLIYGAMQPTEEGWTLEMATGGHLPPLLLRAGGEVKPFGPAGMILGATREPKISSWEIGLRPGDAVILYTDGITEARSTTGEFFGEERLRKLCEGCTELSAEELAEKIEATVRKFQQDNLRDDIALLALKITR